MVRFSNNKDEKASKNQGRHNLGNASEKKFDKFEKERNNIVLKNIKKCCCILIKMKRQAKIKEDIIKGTQK